MIINNIKIPIGETIWVSYLSEDEVLEYITTSKENDRIYYFFYKVNNDGSLSKISKNKNPIELEELIHLNDKS